MGRTHIDPFDFEWERWNWRREGNGEQKMNERESGILIKKEWNKKLLIEW